MNFFIRTEYNLIFVFLLILISFLIAFLYYKRSQLTKKKKFFFSSLRFLSSFLILFLLASPVLSYIKNVSGSAVNIFLIDNSKSLLIENRDSIIKDFLNKDAGTIKGENKYYFFSADNLIESGPGGFDTIKYQGINNEYTDLSKGFELLNNLNPQDNLSSITVISDGIINDGGNPKQNALTSGVPVNYILIGDTIQKKDVVVKNVFYNKTSFIESEVPVKAEILSYGTEGKIRINLLEEGNSISSKEIEVNGNSNSYNVEFKIGSSSEGIKKYEIRVENIPGEITEKNNYEYFFIDILTNKFRTLVISGGPSSDFAFISGEIRKISNIQSTFLTQKSSMEFYEGPVPDINGYDAFIFINYPTSISNPLFLSNLKERLESEKISLFFISGRNTDYKKLSFFDEHLPFRVISESDIEVERSLKTVSNISSDFYKNPELLGKINSFPSVFRTGINVSVNPSSETMVTTNTYDPVLIIQNSGTNRSAAFLAHGIYKWRLNPQKINAEEVLNSLITNTLLAITRKDNKRKFNIETNRAVYSKYEKVRFKASLTNEDVSGGESISIEIRGSSFTTRLDLKRSGSFFEGLINIPVEGDYSYTAVLNNKNGYVESVQGRFIIGENNLEFRETKSDRSLLASLSIDSRGMDLTGKDIHFIEDIFNRQSFIDKIPEKKQKRVDLTTNIFYLVSVILILCIEWFLRKRNNLA